MLNAFEYFTGVSSFHWLSYKEHQSIFVEFSLIIWNIDPKFQLSTPAYYALYYDIIFDVGLKKGKGSSALKTKQLNWHHTYVYRY